MRPLIQARNSRFTVLTYGNFGHCANPRSAEVMGHSMVFHIYIYIYNPPIGANHGSCICFHRTNRAICGCKKSGPFSSLVIEPLEKSGHQMWPVTPFLPRQFCKTWSESFVKASQMTKKMARVFWFFRFQSWWHYTFEGRISLTWSNDSGCSGWSAQLFACSFLLCEMSTSKPLDIFQRTPSGKLVHSNTWKEKKQTLFILVVFAWGRIQATWNNLAILWIQSFSYSGFQCFFVLNGDFSGDLIGLVFINTVNLFQCLVSNLRKLAQAGWCMHPNTL